MKKRQNKKGKFDREEKHFGIFTPFTEKFKTFRTHMKKKNPFKILNQISQKAYASSEHQIKVKSDIQSLMYKIVK